MQTRTPGLATLAIEMLKEVGSESYVHVSQSARCALSNCCARQGKRCVVILGVDEEK